MAETTVKPKLTEEEFLRLPNDGWKYEVDPEAQTVTVYRSLRDVRVYRAEEEIEGGRTSPQFPMPSG